MNKRQEQRIRIAIAHLRSIPKEVADKHVNMYTWGPMPSRKISTMQLMRCGTAACAAGWLGRVPALYADGLRMVPFPEFDCPGGPLYDSAALAEFFGITYLEASTIFEGEYWKMDGKEALDKVCEALERLLPK